MSESQAKDAFRVYEQFVKGLPPTPPLMQFSESWSRHRTTNPLHWLRVNTTRGSVTLEATGPMSWTEKADMLRDALRVVEAEAVRPSKTYPVEAK